MVEFQRYQNILKELVVTEMDIHKMFIDTRRESHERAVNEMYSYILHLVKTVKTPANIEAQRDEIKGRLSVLMASCDYGKNGPFMKSIQSIDEATRVRETKEFTTPLVTIEAKEGEKVDEKGPEKDEESPSVKQVLDGKEAVKSVTPYRKMISELQPEFEKKIKDPGLVKKILRVMWRGEEVKCYEKVKDVMKEFKINILSAEEKRRWRR